MSETDTMPELFDGRYVKEFLAGWGSMDLNGHLANTGYLNLAADVRMSFFAEHGFPPDEFRRLGIGPVIRKEELEYFREVALHETVMVTHAALGMSPDGSRFIVENEIWSARRERAAVVRSTGGWVGPSCTDPRRSATGVARSAGADPAGAGIRRPVGAEAALTREDDVSS